PTPTPTPTPQPATSAPAAVSTPAATDDLQTACIDSHNVHRGNHSAPALSWDAEIAGYAAITAKTCVFEHDMATGGGGYGQNLAMWGATGSESLGAAKAAQKAITEQWYNGELNLYTGYGQASPDMTDFLKWGHFTQMVWKDTTTVGCAVEYCAAGTLSSIGSWFTVCNYKKQGNVIGSFDTNVLPALGEATVNAN
ncbi:scp-like extracellular protein, partial [Colletotrichum chrysophilum]